MTWTGTYCSNAECKKPTYWAFKRREDKAAAAAWYQKQKAEEENAWVAALQASMEPPSRDH